MYNKHYLFFLVILAHIFVPLLLVSSCSHAFFGQLPMLCLYLVTYLFLFILAIQKLIMRRKLMNTECEVYLTY